MATLKNNLDSLQQTARERTVKTQNIEYDLETLVKKIKNGSIKLDPEYQRRHRWTPVMSSRLIESLILNIPIPVIFISQDVDVDREVGESISRYTVIDGQQRLTAIVEFMSNEYPLEGLDVLKELNDSYYKNLPPFLIRRLEERTIKCLRIDSTVDEQVKYDIFERLNTGYVHLEAQELRNAVVRGPFNDTIKQLAENIHFRHLIQVNHAEPLDSVKVQKMEDVELVLRFFALKDKRYKELKKGFRDFLTDKLIEFNKLPLKEIDKWKSEFATYMAFIYEHAGKFAFAKFRGKKPEFKKMSSFNAAVFDAVAVGFSEVFSVEDLEKDSRRAIKALEGYRSIFEALSEFCVGFNQVLRRGWFVEL